MRVSWRMGNSRLAMTPDIAAPKCLQSITIGADETRLAEHGAEPGDGGAAAGGGGGVRVGGGTSEHFAAGAPAAADDVGSCRGHHRRHRAVDRACGGAGDVSV